MKKIATYPVYTTEEARSFEAGRLGGDPVTTERALRNAGAAIGRALHADFREWRPWPSRPRLLILAGKGHNSGDAVVAAGMLGELLGGVEVKVIHTAAAEERSELLTKVLEELGEQLGDHLTEQTLEEWRAADKPVEADVVLDGVYGLGFRPPLGEEVAELLEACSASEEPIFRAAMDVPSGVGETSDERAFVADFTYVPGVAKESLFRAEHRAYTGRIRFLEVEPFLDQEAAGAAGRALVVSPGCFRRLNRLRPAVGDKRQYGHVLVLAGSPRMPGAALMATRAALQSGAGLVTCLMPGNLAPRIAGHAPEAMWQPLPLNREGGLEGESVRVVNQLAGRADALLIGPGMEMDKATVYAVSRVIRETEIPLVLDASALTQDIMSAVAARANRAGPLVLTPHEGEYLRMHGYREENAAEEQIPLYCQRFGCVLVLKRNPVLVATGEDWILAPHGGPVLARGGSGDVLSGMLACLLAQNPNDPRGAALDAVSWHAAAGEALARERGSHAVRTTEMLEFLPRVLRGRVGPGLYR